MKVTRTMLHKAIAAYNACAADEPHNGGVCNTVFLDMALDNALRDLPEPIDITQLPAYIELQKRLALAEAKLEAVRKWNTPDPNEWTTCRFHHLKKILDDQ